MEQRGGGNALRLALEAGTVGEFSVFEFLDAQVRRQPYPSCLAPTVLGPSRNPYHGEKERLES
jgi:hypothetical protein